MPQIDLFSRLVSSIIINIGLCDKGTLMLEHALICPQCKAPLTAHRFAKSAVCSFCGTTVFLEDSNITSEQFHEAFRFWNAPETYALSSWISLGNRNWVLEKQIARGESSDVYTGRLARWPTELVVIKILQKAENERFLDNEWESLHQLKRSHVTGADVFTRMIPQPVAFGKAGAGSFSGAKILVLRWESGFHHTFEEVCRHYPEGIPARASIWVWRRILETLAFLHSSGYVHGAVVPEHLLVQRNEHGVRLVGYGRSGRINNPLNTVCDSLRPYFPSSSKKWTSLTPQLDIVMSAKCIIKILGGDPDTDTLPTTVPSKLADVVRKYAQLDSRIPSNIDAWSIHQELGRNADTVYGAPVFIPIEMPR